MRFFFAAPHPSTMSPNEFSWNGSFDDYNSHGMNQGFDSTINNQQQVGWLPQSDDYGMRMVLSNSTFRHVHIFLCFSNP